MDYHIKLLIHVPLLWSLKRLIYRRGGFKKPLKTLFNAIQCAVFDYLIQTCKLSNFAEKCTIT